MPAQAGLTECEHRDFRKDFETQSQDYEFQARDTFSLRNDGPENRGKKSACMATIGSHTLLSHWNQEKSGGGRWKEGARLGPEATT
jgi:hypothetical protein